MRLQAHNRHLRAALAALFTKVRDLAAVVRCGKGHALPGTEQKVD